MATIAQGRAGGAYGTTNTGPFGGSTRSSSSSAVPHWVQDDECKDLLEKQAAVRGEAEREDVVLGP